MERITSLETGSQEFPRFCVSCRSVNCRPLWRELIAALETPVCISLGDTLPNLFRTDVFEQALPHNFADFSLIICNQVFGDAPDNLIDLLLPLQVVVRHF